jgi:hypothetical protein
VEGRPWHEQLGGEFVEIRRSIEKHFPYLRIVTADGKTVLQGDLPIVLDARVIDSFDIEVIVSSAGPREEIPIVREIGGRIPQTADRHIEESTGRACLFVPDEYWYEHPDGMDLLEFLQGPVTAFFISQVSFERGYGWPFGQRSHGANGVLEFYKSVLGIADDSTVRSFVEIISRGQLRGRSQCPCGSGLRINACHAPAIRELRSRIKPAAARASLRTLSSIRN